MQNKTNLSLFAVLALAIVPPCAQSQSLFPVKKANQQLHGSSSAGFASLFSDVKAHEVGDILIITIAESTTANSTATTKVAKDESVTGFGGSGLFQRLTKELAFTANDSSSHNGTGTTSRSGTLVTTLSVSVKEVLPNGTLKIEGSRIIGINKETQRVTFSGRVRPEDITSDNTIASNLIADVETHYDGKGIVGSTQKRGLLSSIFHYIF